MSETSKWGGLDFPRTNNSGSCKILPVTPVSNINYLYGLTFRNIIVSRDINTNKPISVFINTDNESVHIQLDEITFIETISTTLTVKTEDGYATFLIAVSEVEAKKIDAIFFDSINTM